MPNVFQKSIEQVKEKSLYDTDFYQWTKWNTELLRQGKLDEIDIENIAEEIESLGKRDKRELISRLAVLIMHLLKYQFQPQKISDSWITTISTQRREIKLVIEDSPSLKYNIDKTIDKAFIEAKRQFEEETNIPKEILSETCPYSWEQLTKHEFLPKF
jgi:hypothetical protein